MGFSEYIYLIFAIGIIGAIVSAIVNRVDDTVQVKSGRAVENYDYIKYFKIEHFKENKFI